MVYDLESDPRNACKSYGPSQDQAQHLAGVSSVLSSVVIEGRSQMLEKGNTSQGNGKVE